ncbi:MAG: glycosyltransferase [Chromatiales bacterium 21-64-14]|nr:MAG: glycosyltransferase [Chromatiales bacterium 21-64-14]
MDLSIVVPFFNEEENVRPQYERIVAALDRLTLRSQLVFVDDGSGDRTWEELRAVAAQDPRVRAIRFRRNYGQTAAMAAGIEYADGAILMTMDGDLQNDPDDIPRFLEMLDKGYDVVVGWRFHRQDRLLTRKIPSQVANWLIGKVTGVPIHDNGCSLKAYRAVLIKMIPLYSEMHRFIPAMASLAGAQIAEIPVNHFPRRYGESKYGLSRIYRVLLDLVTIKTLLSSVDRPLLWFGAIAGGSLVISVGALLAALLDPWALHGSPVLISMGISLLFGAEAAFMMFSGVFSELVYRTGDVQIEKLSEVTAEVFEVTPVGGGR